MRLLICGLMIALVIGAEAALPATAPNQAPQAPAKPAPLPLTPIPGQLTGTLTSSLDRTDHLVLDKQGLTLAAPILRNAFADTEVGDRLTITVDDLGNPQKVTAVISAVRGTSFEGRALAVLLSAAILIVAASLTTRLRPQTYLLGADGLYSNSQTQLALWFGTVAVVYSAILLLRLHYLGSAFIGGIAVPDHVLAITGLSAFTFGSAKVIAVNKATAAGAPATPERSPAFVRDLVTNNAGVPDLGDFQMIVISVVAASIFVIAAWRLMTWLPIASQTSLPDLDSTLLGSFGIGQGAYLLKKAALPKDQG